MSSRLRWKTWKTKMKDLTELDKFRIPIPKIYGDEEQYDKARNGAFVVHLNGELLRILAASGQGWDHVSVSLSYRIPTWTEMEFIKRTFFKPDETAMQLHVPEKDHINTHPFVLHLWRPHKKEIPLPPKGFV